MSWKDRLENTVFMITTGDGKVFRPLWKSGETSKEFNATTFDFINVEGSKIDRKKVKARKFPLTFWLPVMIILIKLMHLIKVRMTTGPGKSVTHFTEI